MSNQIKFELSKRDHKGPNLTNNNNAEHLYKQYQNFEKDLVNNYGLPTENWVMNDEDQTGTDNSEF